MANTKELKKRLKSISGIEKITQAMKMVATARVKKFQALAQDSAPYTEYLQNIIRDLAVNCDLSDSPIFKVRKTNNKVLYIVMGADSGMCGSFNTNVMNKAMERISKRLKQKHKVYVICVGKKCGQFFSSLAQKHENLKIVMVYEDYGANVNDEKIYSLADKAIDMYMKEDVDAVRIIYAKYINAMSQIPSAINFLPVDKFNNNIIRQKSDVAEAGEADYTGQIFNEATGKMLHHKIRQKSDVVFEPSEKEILDAFIPKYLNNIIYHSVLESMASEFGAKMTAMTGANQNAKDMIGELSREFNKIRQTTITNELIDIVNGGNA